MRDSKIWLSREDLLQHCDSFLIASGVDVACGQVAADNRRKRIELLGFAQFRDTLIESANIAEKFAVPLMRRSVIRIERNGFLKIPFCFGEIPAIAVGL